MINKMLLGGKNEKNIEPTNIIEGSGYALPSSNGGRKIVRLDSGVYASVVIENNDTMCVYKSYDKGVTWSRYISSYSASIITDVSIATDGVFIYILYSYSKNNEGGIRCKVVNSAVPTGTNFLLENVRSTSCCSLAISHDRLKICATWSSKTDSYPNCYNIRVRQGTISNGSISWETAKQLTYETNSSNSMSQPTVIYDSYVPTIFFIAHTSSIYNVRQYYFNGTNFYHKSNIGDVNTSYTKAYPCATFMPQNISTKINGSYTKGLIMVTWCAYDSSVSNYYNIHCQASSDEGNIWIDWAKGGMDKLTYGDTYHQWLPTICWNNDGDIFIIWRNDKDGINHNISYIKWCISSGWSSVKTIKKAYEQTWPNAIDNYHNYKKPIFVYQDSSVDEPSIDFYGEH